jgi:hypothetical protein
MACRGTALLYFYNAEIARKACELYILLPYQTIFVAVVKRNGTNTVFKDSTLRKMTINAANVSHVHSKVSITFLIDIW